MQINREQKTKKPLLVVAVIAVCALIGGWIVYASIRHQWPFPTITSTTNQNTSSNDNSSYSAPTQEEIDSSQDAKKALESSDSSSTNTSSSTSSGKKTVAVGISYADIYNSKLEIRAFTSSAVEGGTCTATVVKKDSSSAKVTKTSSAFIDATSTQCQPIYIPSSSLSSGTWEVTVTFSSSDYQGTSDTVEVTVS